MSGGSVTAGAWLRAVMNAPALRTGLCSALLSVARLFSAIALIILNGPPGTLPCREGRNGQLQFIPS